MQALINGTEGRSIRDTNQSYKQEQKAGLSHLRSHNQKVANLQNNPHEIL